MSSWSTVWRTHTKTAQFSEEDKDGHLVSISLACTIFSVSWASKVNSICAIFGGIYSCGGFRVQLFEWPTWELTGSLVINVAWKVLPSASTLFYVTINWVDGKVMVRLSKGSLIIRTSVKWLSVCIIKICIDDHENTHSHQLHDETTQAIQQTCSTWLIKGASDKHDTRDLFLIDHDDTRETVNLTPCVSGTEAFVANITSTHKAKTLSITRTWSHIWLRYQHEKTWMN